VSRLIYLAAVPHDKVYFTGRLGENSMKVRVALGMMALALAAAGSGAGFQAIARSSPSAVPAQGTLGAVDQAAIRAIISTFADSWTRHDMNTMHTLQTNDVEWINVVGNDWRGLPEVRRGHTNYLHFLAARSTSSVESVAVRPIAPNVAIAVAVFHFAGFSPDGKAEEARTRASIVMVKQTGKWKIIHFHNTIINPATQGPADPLNFDEKTGLPKTGN
jgi:uncharacterized protein (TIGR02246 family)